MRNLGVTDQTRMAQRFEADRAETKSVPVFEPWRYRILIDAIHPIPAMVAGANCAADLRSIDFRLCATGSAASLRDFFSGAYTSLRLLSPRLLRLRLRVSVAVARDGCHRKMGVALRRARRRREPAAVRSSGPDRAIRLSLAAWCGSIRPRRGRPGARTRCHHRTRGCAPARSSSRARCDRGSRARC